MYIKQYVCVGDSLVPEYADVPESEEDLYPDEDYWFDIDLFPEHLIHLWYWYLNGNNPQNY